jgi:transposase InsO family protein
MSSVPISQHDDIVEFPSVAVLHAAQHEDATFTFWFEWLAHATIPSVPSEVRWWKLDKDYVVLDGQNLLVRVARLTTSTRSAPVQQILIPHMLRDCILFLFHGHNTIGHQGIPRTYAAMRQHVYWHTMRADITTYITGCRCQGVKHRTPQQTSYMGDLISTWPNQLVAIDCSGPLPITTYGNRYLVVMQDHFTKWVVAKAVDGLSADRICEIIYHSWILAYGPMSILLSDNGTEFKNELLTEGLCKLLGIRKHFITPLHPQSDGTVERFMRTIKSLLTVQSRPDMKDWDQHLAALVYAYNTSIHSVTGEHPYYLWFGRPPTSFYQISSDELGRTMQGATIQYRQQLLDELYNAYDLVLSRLHLSAEDNAKRKDAGAILQNWTPGDLVWLHDPTQSSLSGSKKMHNPWTGPFVLAKCFDNKTAELLYPSKTNAKSRITVNVDRLRRYVAPITELFLQKKLATALPLTVLSRRLHNGTEQFLVRQLSLDPKPDTWIPATEVPANLKDHFYRRNLAACCLLVCQQRR